MNDSVNSDVGSRVVARGDYSSKGRREREKRGRVVNHEPASLRIFTIERCRVYDDGERSADE